MLTLGKSTLPISGIFLDKQNAIEEVSVTSSITSLCIKKYLNENKYHPFLSFMPSVFRQRPVLSLARFIFEKKLTLKIASRDIGPCPLYRSVRLLKKVLVEHALRKNKTVR